jgi:hypothetical protein
MRIIRRRRLALLAGAAVALAVVAIVAVSVFLLLQPRQPALMEWRDPISSMPAEQINPQLALYPLAGASESETIDAGIDNGELATAYAALVYSSGLSDRQRIGRLAALGEELSQAGSTSLAAATSQQIYDLALLSPRLNDPLRADALRLAAQGWGREEQKGSALKALGEAAFIAASSPYLQTAQRRALLTALEPVYQNLGESTLATEMRNQVVALDQASYVEPSYSRAEPADLPSEGEPMSSPEVGTLEEARRQAAYAVINSLSQDLEPSSELLSTLAEALKTEDAAKLSLYSQELTASTQPGRRSEIHQHLVRWLLLKLRVATKGFGLSIVPEWESQISDIQASLSKAYEDLTFDYEDWAASLPDAIQMAPSSYAALRSVVLTGRLGQYPNYPAEQLVQKLEASAVSMVDAGYIDDLYVKASENGTDVQFSLSRGADYVSSP